MKQLTTVQLKNKILIFEIKDFEDSPIDTEWLLQVDKNSPIGDICTFPVLFNRIGNIKAEIDDYLREVQLDFEIFQAQKREEFRKSLVTQIDDGKGKGGKKTVYPTIAEVDDALIRSPEYKVKKIQLNKVKKEVDIIDALYWAAKSKDKKLDAISAKLKPEDFEKEILEGTINSVLIRVYKNPVAGGR